MTEAAWSNELERQRKCLNGLNVVVLAALAAASGLAFFFILARQDAVKAAPHATARALGESQRAREPAPTVGAGTQAAAGTSSAGVKAEATFVPPAAASAPASEVAPQERPSDGAQGVAASKGRVAGGAPPMAERGGKTADSGAHHCQASGWYVQLGALRGDDHVRSLLAQSSGHGFPVCTLKGGGSDLVLVLAGPYREGHAAVQARDRVKKMLGIQGFLRDYGKRD